MTSGIDMATVQTSKIDEIRLKEGSLPEYAWPGGYPLFYLDGDSCCLCPACANKEDEYTSPTVAYDINWEDGSLYCDDCSERIESAYGDNS